MSEERARPPHIGQDEADEYALGACDPEVAREIALHLIECRECASRVAAAEELTARIALAAPVEQANPRLRARLLEETGISRPSVVARVARLSGVAATIAAIALGALAMASMFGLRDDVRDLRSENDTMARELRQVQSQEIEIAALTQELQTTTTDLAELQAQLQEDKQLQLALLSPNREEANVYSVDPDARSVGRFIWDPDQGKFWFLATNLPPLQGGDTYELFAGSGQTYVSLGTFNADPQGFVRFEAEIPEGLESYDNAVVTIERRWGERERTGPSVFILDLSAFGQ